MVVWMQDKKCCAVLRQPGIAGKSWRRTWQRMWPDQGVKDTMGLKDSKWLMVTWQRTEQHMA